MFPQLSQSWPSLAAAVAVLALAAWASGQVTSRILHRVIGGVTSRTRSTWDDRLVERGVFRRLALVVQAVVVYLGIGRALDLAPPGLTEGWLALADTVVRRVAAAFIAFAVVRAFRAFLDDAERRRARVSTWRLAFDLPPGLAASFQNLSEESHKRHAKVIGQRQELTRGYGLTP